MTDKEKYIKKAFQHYNENKKRLNSLSYDGLKAVDYSRQQTKAVARSDDYALIKYVDEKQKLLKAVAVVDRTLDYYDIRAKAFADGKATYIRFRWVKKMSYEHAAIECNIPSSTACYWLKEIREVAYTICDIYKLW